MAIVAQPPNGFQQKIVESYLRSLRHLEVDGCTEIRILTKTRYIGNNGTRAFVGTTVSGYYTDYAKAAKDIAVFDGKAHVYATLNPVKPILMRRAHNRLEYNATHTASDADILKILWVPFDIDPKRPTHTSASDVELQAALARRDKIIGDLFDPHSIPVIRAMSGNGGHGLIPLVGEPNTPETQTEIKRLIDWLSETFSDEIVDVDRTIANPARIWKVYGTLACKGDNTPEAPYRRAFIELPQTPPEPIELRSLVDKVFPSAPPQSPLKQGGSQRTEPAPQHTPAARPHELASGTSLGRLDDDGRLDANAASLPSNGHGDYPFLNVSQYLSNYGYRANVKTKGERTIYELDRCPFNPEHNRGEVCITQEASGKLGFKCFHNSCSDKRWKSARAAIGDPKPFYEGNGKHSHQRPQQPQNTKEEPVNSPHTHTDSPPVPATAKPKMETEQATPMLDALLSQVAEIPRIDRESEKRNRAKTIIAASVGLDPLDQSAVISQLHQTGVGNKSILDAQLKAAKHDHLREHWSEMAHLEDNGLPIIETTHRHLRDITADAMDALRNHNGSPKIFVRGGVLTRIKPYEAQTIVSEVLTKDALRGELARAADFVGGKDFMGNPIHQPVSPPTDVVNDLMALPQWGPGIPHLKEIIHAPVFTADGTFETKAGYQPKSQSDYVQNGLKIGETTPTDENVDAAKSLIEDDLLGEFCFADQASRANALALMLLPFVRPLIDGNTPFHLIDAPTEGSGKGLLADVLTIPFKPDLATLMTEGESDEEWRKRLTAVLAEAPSHVLIDNITKRLDAGSFAAALTAPHWSDRLLGTNTTVKFPVSQVWMGTGNNVEMSPEITRRTVWIRLRPADEDPSQRTFKIENLSRWAQEHRSELVTACLTLIRKWVDSGMPRGPAKKGSYADWAAIMSGILEAGGVDGFLGNLAALGERANQDALLWREFVAAWQQRHGTSPVGVSDLFLMASTKEDFDDDGRKVEIGQNLLGELLRSNTERGRQVKLGDLLKGQVDRVYGEWRIVKNGLRKRARQYHLAPANVDVGVGETDEAQNGNSSIDSPPSKPHEHSVGASSASQTGNMASEGGAPPKAALTFNEVVEVKTDAPDTPPTRQAAPPLETEADVSVSVSDVKGTKATKETPCRDVDTDDALLSAWAEEYGVEEIHVNRLADLAAIARYFPKAIGRPAIVEATRQQMVEWAEAGRIHQVNSAVFQLHRS